MRWIIIKYNLKHTKIHYHRLLISLMDLQINPPRIKSICTDLQSRDREIFQLPALISLPRPPPPHRRRGGSSRRPPGQSVVVHRALLRIGERGVRRVHSNEFAGRIAAATADVGVQSPRQPPVGGFDFLESRAGVEP